MNFCSSKDNFGKEAGGWSEFSEQSVSQMEENRNNEGQKWTQIRFPLLSCSSPAFCSVPVYYFQSCFIEQKDFQRRALSTKISTISAAPLL